MGAIRASLLYASPSFNFLGVADPHLPGARALADKYHVPHTADSLSTMMNRIGNDHKVEGVVVSTPTFTHEDVFRDAADMGLHIFTEKPIDETATKIKSIYDYTKSKNVKLCCGFQRRFDPTYTAVQQSIAQGKIGDISLANVIFHDSPTPKLEFLLTGGDIFMDLAPHDVDYVLWCLGGSEVESVYATGTSSR